MFLHHLATISLITFSYVNNMARVGTLVMCLHDAADVLIEVRMCETANSGSGQMVGEKRRQRQDRHYVVQGARFLFFPLKWLRSEF